MKKYSNLISIIKTISEIGRLSTGVSIKTVEHLGEIAPDVKHNIALVKSWLNGDTIYVEETEECVGKQPTEVSPLVTEGGYLRFDPAAEWRHVNDLALWCSSSGLIYSEEKDELLKPKYHNGDYMVTVDETDATAGKKRAGVIMARAFKIQSENRNDDTYVLEYRDGDRKNIKPDNLYWRQYETYTLQVRTIEDICRRIIDSNGDIDNILEDYDENDRFVTRQFVRSLLEKKQFTTITDRFFTRTMSGKIVSKVVKDTRPVGLDIGELLRRTQKLDMVKKLLRDKIKDGNNSLTVDEEAILVILAVVEGKKLNNKDIAKYIRENFHITIAHDTIENWKSAKDNQLYKIIGG